MIELILEWLYDRRVGLSFIFIPAAVFAALVCLAAWACAGGACWVSECSQHRPLAECRADYQEMHNGN